MKVTELKDELKKRGKSRAGNKPDFVSRLKLAIEQKAPVLPEGVNEDAPTSFAKTSFWEVLTSGQAVYNPLGQSVSVAPTNTAPLESKNGETARSSQRTT